MAMVQIQEEAVFDGPTLCRFHFLGETDVRAIFRCVEDSRKECLLCLWVRDLLGSLIKTFAWKLGDRLRMEDFFLTVDS
jgi:hypothetical protein